MRLTTLCYIEKDGCWLMMHRVKKDADENAGKWIGIGGHLEENESPEECIRREAREEAGAELKDLRLRGIITFILPDWGNELTFLYTARADNVDLSKNSEEGVKEMLLRAGYQNIRTHIREENGWLSDIEVRKRFEERLNG